MDRLWLTFYGDDFTGSTDSMEALTKGGLRTALFLQPPTPEMLAGRFSGLQALGVAGVSRSLAPPAMEAELRPKFRQLKALGAPLMHYKVCSTFDSSPEVGSIGLATDIGVEVFDSRFVPLMVGAPILRRYVLFGNLFARVGEITYRLDHHPTMSRHPITPMTESDLRLHLGKQTDKRMDVMDVWHMAQSQAAQDARFAALLEAGAEIILFDTLDDSHLPIIGRFIWENRGDAPLFIVGSSGVEYALTAYWQQIGMLEPPDIPNAPGRVEQLIVTSGSAAPATQAQIEYALGQGYVGIRLDTEALIDPDKAQQAVGQAIAAALAELAHGCSVVLFAALGPDDPAIARTREAAARLGFDAGTAGREIARRQGEILRILLTETGLRRVCVAGGDTSGFAAQALDILALEMIVPIAPGGPLCRATAHSSQFDGLEITLKGGQVGNADYFVLIQNGGN